jgi:hypothetical protein
VHDALFEVEEPQPVSNASHDFDDGGLREKAYFGVEAPVGAVVDDDDELPVLVVEEELFCPDDVGVSDGGQQQPFLPNVLQVDLLGLYDLQRIFPVFMVGCQVDPGVCSLAQQVDEGVVINCT